MTNRGRLKNKVVNSLRSLNFEHTSLPYPELYSLAYDGRHSNSCSSDTLRPEEPVSLETRVFRCSSQNPHPIFFRVNESIDQFGSSNDAPGIHQLPIELLLWIFDSALASWYYSDGSTYYRHLCALSRVCIRWYNIVHHFPQLWATVPGSINKEGLRKVVERSSSKLIDIVYEPLKGARSHAEFLDILGSTTGRWRTVVLEINWFCSEDRPGNFLQFPAPDLERLVFKNNKAWSMRNVELFGGNCPNLKDISVDRAECKWSQPAFRGLENLKLSYMSFDSVGDILDAIRDISQLKRLEICDCDAQEEVPGNTQPVTLPNLQFLRAEFDNDDGIICATEQFLGHISAPPRCPLYISLVDVDDREDSFVATFCEWLFGRQPKAVLEAVESFKLGFHVTEDDVDALVTFELFSGSVNIEGGIRGPEEEDIRYVLKYIQDLFQRSCASKTSTRLILSGCGAELLNNSHLIAPFEGLPQITHLELVEPIWSPHKSSDVNLSEGATRGISSPFVTIRNHILRGVSPGRHSRDNPRDIRRRRGAHKINGRMPSRTFRFGRNSYRATCIQRSGSRGGGSTERFEDRKSRSVCCSVIVAHYLCL